MRIPTSEVHDQCMENLYFTQQLIIDLRNAKETEACRRRLAKGDAEPVTCPAQPGRRYHRVIARRRISLAGG